MNDLFEMAVAARLTGGGGGTSDYSQLTNKPSINGTILVGNKTLSDLGIEWVWRGTRAQYEAAAATIPPNTFVDITDEPDIDNFPTQGSLNPVTSNGLYAELSKLKVINENPENHNGIYRGKDLTNIYTIEQIYERVHDGSFEDLYLGDYFTVNITTDLYTRFTGSAFESGVTYYEMGGTVIARTWTETQDAEPQSGKVYATKQVVTEDVDLEMMHFDYYFGLGLSEKVLDHHVVLMAKDVFTTITPLNLPSFSDDSTGYTGSNVHNIVLPCYAEALGTALNGHILTRADRLPSTIDPDVPSMAGTGAMGATVAFANAAYKLALPSENQCFGTHIAGSSWRDVCLDYGKFAALNFENIEHNPENMGFYLRTFSRIESNSYKYCYVNVGGLTSTLGTTGTSIYARIRPYFLFG